MLADGSATSAVRGNGHSSSVRRYRPRRPEGDESRADAGLLPGGARLTVERIFEKLNLHQVRCGRNLIDIMPLKPGETLAAPADRGIEHLCLSINGDIDEVAAALQKAGIAIDMGPMEVYGQPVSERRSTSPIPTLFDRAQGALRQAPVVFP